MMVDRTTKTSGREKALQEAAEWVVHVEGGDFSSDDIRAFQAWLDASPDHTIAYEELRTLWDEIPNVPGLGSRWPKADNDLGEASNDNTNKWPRLIGAFAAIAAAAAFALLPPIGRVSAIQHFKTDIAQVSKVTLTDGSIATMGPMTELTVDFSDNERRLRLNSGEAFFDVAKDRERPFLVEAGRTAVKAVGTSFNVKDGDEFVVVAVLEGGVDVLDRKSAAAKKPLGTLHPGDMARVSQNGDGPRVEISRTASNGRLGMLAAGWRDGWLSYDNAKLGHIVDDLNRYYKPGVTLRDPSAGALQVTASFRTEDMVQFLHSLPGILPVVVERRTDGGYLLRSYHEPR